MLDGTAHVNEWVLQMHAVLRVQCKPSTRPSMARELPCTACREPRGLSGQLPLHGIYALCGVCSSVAGVLTSHEGRLVCQAGSTPFYLDGQDPSLCRHPVMEKRTCVCSTGPQAGRLSGAGTRLSWPPHDSPPSSEIAQYMPCPSLPSHKFSEPCT